jgi:hypothetical protein
MLNVTGPDAFRSMGCTPAFGRKDCGGVESYKG